MERYAAEDAAKADRHAALFSRAGLTMKVLKPIGPLMTVASVVYDVRSGYSTRRALFTAGTGAAAGGALAAFLVALSAPPGWVVAGGAVVGVIVGGFAAPEFYDAYIMSARERLTQTPDAPETDPGPTRLS